MKQSIGILANYLFRDKKTGVEVYATEIVSRLLLRPEVDWCLLVDRHLEAQAGARFPGVRRLPLTGSLGVDLVWSIPRYAAKGEFRVFFNPTQYTYFGPSQRSAACGFDVAWRYYPSYFPLRQRLIFEGLTRYLCHACEKIFCISKSTIADLVSHFGLAEHKAVLAYPAYDCELYNPSPHDSDADILNALGVRGPYVLHLGTLQRRKNVELLIDVFERLERSDLQLVLAGGPGWGYPEILARIRNSRLSRAILQTGDVTDQQKAALYRNAAVFANLSLYEGFGIPVLEAMACGAPTMVSRASSFPEILDDERFSVDLGVREEIVSKMKALLVDGPSSVRERMLQRAARFSWSQSAGKIFAALSDL